MSRSTSHCAICSRKQADGLISGAAWGRLELPRGTGSTTRRSGLDAPRCPTCVGAVPRLAATEPSCRSGSRAAASAVRLPPRPSAAAQNSPTVSPDSSMSIANAAGVFPSPGIVIMSPHSATIQPAPVYGPQVAHRDGEAGRRVLERRVVREREVRLRHADRKPRELGALPTPRPSSSPPGAARRRRRRRPASR